MFSAWFEQEAAFTKSLRGKHKVSLLLRQPTLRRARGLDVMRPTKLRTAGGPQTQSSSLAPIEATVLRRPELRKDFVGDKSLRPTAEFLYEAFETARGPHLASYSDQERAGRSGSKPIAAT